MKYYYGDSYKDALANDPVEIKTARRLRDYEDNYTFVIPADEVDDDYDDEEEIEEDESEGNLTLGEAEGMLQDILDWFSDHEQAQEDIKTYLTNCGWDDNVVEYIFTNGINIE